MGQNSDDFGPSAQRQAPAFFRVQTNSLRTEPPSIFRSNVSHRAGHMPHAFRYSQPATRNSQLPPPQRFADTLHRKPNRANAIRPRAAKQLAK
jgi:hypothetical protein